MKFNHEIKEQVLIISLDGDIIGENIGLELLEVVNDAILEKIKFCTIDISGVRYVNSSGIGLLITILTKFKNNSGDVYLINPSDHVQKLFIITKLNVIFNIVQTKEEALQKIKNIK